MLKHFVVILTLAILTTISVYAEGSNEKPLREVSHLIKCHEGKFDAMNAVSQLTSEISEETVYGWSGIGAYPDNSVVGEMVFIKAPFQVSSPTFVQIRNTTYACVTVSKGR